MTALLASALLAAVVPLAARADPASLTVAAAANLRPALSEISAAFEARNPGARVRVSYGASATLYAQIRNGAPFDLFLSADAAMPEALARAGQAEGAVFRYARGTLVLWVPKDSKVEIEKRGLQVLLDPAVSRIAIANPAVAPYGAAARAALENAGLYESVKAKLVLGEDVQQTAQFAQSGNAQAALLPLSLAAVPPLAAEGRHAPVPAGSYPPVVQAGVVLARTRQAALARNFTAFLLGPEGSALFQKHGYAPASAR